MEYLGQVFYMGYHGGQFPVDKAFANSTFYKLWLMKELFRFASETAVKVIKLQTKLLIVLYFQFVSIIVLFR